MTSKKTKKKDKEKQEEVDYPVAAIVIPKTRHIKPVPYSLSRVGLEVYKTDEENYEPYTPNGNTATQDTGNEEEEDDSDLKGFTLHMGEIVETAHYSRLKSVSYESDYADMTDSGSIKLSTIDINRFYKGVRVKLLSEWEAPPTTLTWENLQEGLLGFITEQTFSSDGVEIKLSGMSKALDQKYKFDFKSMKRSEILAEVIKTAGLIPAINVEGLDDDITDFNNSSSDKKDSSSSSSELAGGEGEEIDSLVKKIVGSETDELKKCKLIHQWLKENVKYEGYECTRYDTPEKCLKHKTALNCADTARLTRAMMASAGLKCYVVHRTTNGGHFWTIIEIGGKKYASDQTGSGSEFNTVWASSGRTSVSDGGSYTRKNDKNPDC